MTFKRLSGRWASQLLALPAAILLMAAFSLAQSGPGGDDPPGEEPPEGECPAGQFWSDPPRIEVNGVWYDPVGICCPDGTACASVNHYDEHGDVTNVTATCSVQPDPE